MKYLILLAAALTLIPTAIWAQPIVDYVNKPDDAFSWHKTGQEDLSGGTTLTHLQVTSQVWQGITWTHRVEIIQPADLQYPETALMLITGGAANKEELAYLTIIAGAVSAPIVILGDIPNQPLFDDLREDALIAHTFAKYIETGDATWPLLFPMTKAAIKTMDAVAAYTEQTWETPVESFVVTGASKRGWTTWFTGVVAPERLKGIAPMVYDNLNMAAQMAHQVEAWGDYSEMIDDYTKLGLPAFTATERGRQVAAMVDPYTDRQRATMPKLIITGTNDPYWPLDAANLYYDQLPDPKYILYVPNSGHGLEDIMRVVNSQIGFFLGCTGRAPLPKPSWEFSEGRYLKLTISPDLAPKRVLQWTASSPTRDFREAQWKQREATEHNGKYICRLMPPQEGYAAIFGEITYEVEGHDFPLSTKVRVISGK